MSLFDKLYQSFLLTLLILFSNIKGYAQTLQLTYLPAPTATLCINYPIQLIMSPNLASNYTVTIIPTLPIGISLDHTNGKIFGTPTISTVHKNYTVTATNGIETQTVTLTFGVYNYTNPNPDFTETLICANELQTTNTSTVLNLPATYIWSFGETVLTQTNANASYLFLSSGIKTISLSVTSSLGCTALKTKTINVVNVNTLAISASSPSICLGDAVILTPTTNFIGGTYTWQPINQITSSISVSPTVETTYTLLYNNSGCKRTATYNVSVNQMTIAVAQSPSTCLGISSDLGVLTNSLGGIFTFYPLGYSTNIISVNPTEETSSYNFDYEYLGCFKRGLTSTLTVNKTTLSAAAITSICLGESTNLGIHTSSVGGTFTILPINTITLNAIVSPLSNTNYTIQYNYLGCVKSAMAAVIINQTTIDIISSAVNNTICMGNPVALTANTNSTGGTYAWLAIPNSTMSIGTASTTVVSPTVSLTNYTLTYTNEGCNVVATKSLTVNQTTLAINASNSVICINSKTITLSAITNSAGGMYTWMPLGINIHSIAVNPTAPITYSLSYEYLGCQQSKSYSVAISQVSLGITSSNSIICSNSQTAILTALTNSMGGLYNWLPYGLNTNSIAVTSSVNLTYSLNYTHLGCFLTSTYNLSVNQMTLGAMSNSICIGNSSSLGLITNSVGGTYTILPIGMVTNNVLISPTVSTTYTVQYERLGCIRSVTSAVYVNQTTLTINPPFICVNGPVLLSAVTNSLGGTYDWGPLNVSSSTVIVNPTNATNYILNYVYLGCATSFTASAIINQLTVNITPLTQTICNNESKNLISTVNTPGGDYYWESSTVSNPSLTATDNVIVSPTINTTYTLTYKYLGCIQTATSELLVSFTPTVIVNSGLTVCANEIPFLTTTVVPAGGTYSWEPFNVNTPTVNMLSTLNTYTVTYTYLGCQAKATGSLTIKQAPSLKINSETVCANNLTTIIASVSPQNGQIMWLPPLQSTALSFTVRPLQTNTYAASYTFDGCKVTETTTVLVHPLPTINCIADELFIFEEWAVNIKVEGSILSYTWNTGQVGGTITFTNMQATDICVTGKDANNCTNSTCQTIQVFEPQLFIPNTITPNGNGLNEIFEVKSTSNIIKYQIQIYDRYGIEVFSAYSIDKFWDGKYKSEKVCQGSYLYNITVQFSNYRYKQYSGTFLVQY